ncbi:MAG: leucine-rich repeat protein [Lachnospiraceae bacterium]|nr:leucine-rich repeat protein [Lachnospiraceae bacterium]
MSKKIKRTIILTIAISFIALGVFCYFHSIHMPAWMTYPYDITILEGNVTINSYLAEEKEISIPDKILGVKVIKISENTFENIGTEAVIRHIPKDIENVEKIYDQESRSYYCIRNDSAWILEYIGEEKQVKIPEEVWGRKVVTVFDGAFRNSEIEDVILPETITRISGCAFDGCKSLKQIVLPAELECIGIAAFAESGIERIEIPPSVKEIKEDAFSFSNLKEVTGLENVEKIGNNPFRRTPWEENYNGDFFCIGEELHLYRGDDEEVIIPETVREIKGAFAIEKDYLYPIKVRKVFVPDSVVAISGHSFWNQNNVEVYIPETVVSIGKGSETTTSIFNWSVGKGTIVTTAGSPAEAYAKKEKIPCRIITKEEMQQEMEAAKKRQENK